MRGLDDGDDFFGPEGVAHMTDAWTARSVVNGCEPSVGFDDSVDVTEGTVAVDATGPEDTVDVPGKNVDLPARDADPRYDLVTVDGTGSINVTSGSPSGVSPRTPEIPDGEVLLAVVRVPADGEGGNPTVFDARILTSTLSASGVLVPSVVDVVAAAADEATARERLRVPTMSSDPATGDGPRLWWRDDTDELKVERDDGTVETLELHDPSDLQNPVLRVYDGEAVRAVEAVPVASSISAAYPWLRFSDGDDLYELTDQSIVPPSVSTNSATNVGATTATLNGSLDDMGGADVVVVGFEYRVQASSTWSTTPNFDRTSTGTFSRDVDDLSAGTSYEFRAVGEGLNGTVDRGNILSFETDSIQISTQETSGISETTATLEGSVDGMGASSTVDVSFQYRESGTTSWQETASEEVSSTGSFARSVSGLDAGTAYEWRAKGVGDDGSSDVGTTKTFETMPAFDGGRMILKPESGDLTNFSAHPDADADSLAHYDINANPPVFDGSYSLKYLGDTTSLTSIISESGLPNYPQTDARMLFFVHTEFEGDASGRGRARIKWNTDPNARSDTDRIEFREDLGEVLLAASHGDATSATASLNISAKWWAVEVFVDGSTGDYQADVYDVSGVDEPDNYTDGSLEASLSLQHTDGIDSEGEFLFDNISAESFREASWTVDLWRTEDKII